MGIDLTVTVAGKKMFIVFLGSVRGNSAIFELSKILPES